MRRALTLSAVLVMLAVLAVSCTAAELSVQKVGDNAKIDWTNLVYVATGSGAMPSAKEEPNRARAKLKAKDYAKMDAIANLLMAIEGTAISYESTGKDYMADTTIKMKIEGFVKNVQISRTWDEAEGNDKIVMVEMRAPMFGNNSPGQVFLQEAAKAEEKPTPAESPGETVVETNVKVVLKPDKVVKTSTNVTIAPSIESKPYTGLIVDCSGYKIDRCMSPKIRRQDGSEVWGTMKDSYDLVLDKGIVAYTTSLAEAKKHPRAGSNPLIIAASGRGGGRFYCDPILSDANADLLESENSKCGFLNRLNVVFVKDPRV